MKNVKQLAVWLQKAGTVTMLTVLVACNSDNDSNSGGGDAEERIITGFFSDSAVEGLSYTTQTQSGTTTALGAFTFKAGETITFSIGDVVIGETAPAKEDMTLLELIPDAELYTTRSEFNQIISDNENHPKLIAFNRLHNTVTFLQSLDEDSDPTNGITIPEGIAVLFAGVTLDFEQNLEYFEDYSRLRVITHRAASMGLLNSGAIPKMGIALDHFYQAQGITYNLGVPTNVTKSVTSSVSEGPTDSFIDYTYDEQGNLLTYSQGGQTLTYTYDENSNLLTLTRDRYDDGTLNTISTYTYTYDDNGNRLTNESRDGDGMLDRMETWTYDDYGNQLTKAVDSNGSGTLNTLYTYTYDDNGNWLTTATDTHADGTQDKIRIYTYDENDNLLTESSDTNADGIPNSTVTYTYNENGNWVTYSSDANADGIPNLTLTRTYDENGNKLTHISDTNADGIPNSTITYSYDENGNKLTHISDNNADGIPNYTATYTYDDNGNRLTETEVSDADSEPNTAIKTWTYDENGNQLTSSLDNNGDGITDSITTYTYDDDNNLLSFSDDRNADGNADLITSYTLIPGSIRALLTSIVDPED